MPASRVPATLEHIEEACEVGVDIGMRIDQRMTHAGLRSEMHDIGKAMRSEQLRHGPAVGNIDLLELEIGPCLELRDSGLLETRVVIGTEAIEADHVVSVRQQPPRNVHADKSGRSGDENRLLQSYVLSRGAVMLPSESSRRSAVCARLTVLRAV
jgi:hypothetical protein